MTDLLAISSQAIDSGRIDQPVNRVNHELSEIGDGIAMVEAFSHAIVFRTAAGLVVFDTSGVQGGALVVKEIGKWNDAPVNTIVYTHGHLDHVGGSGAFALDARAHNRPRPQFIGHHNVAPRFARYDTTTGYNLAINARQFSGRNFTIGGAGRFLPEDVVWPDISYQDSMTLKVGELDIELHHAKGETDDHTWSYIPAKKAICAGDFFIWNFPNAGNPQKVQRYPLEWAAAMRTMAAKDSELFLPAHGLPIAGRQRIRTVLGNVATALENLVRDTLAMMNSGAKLDDILHSVKVPKETLELPYLRPLYDEPEFVVRNIWRLYGGWYDGNPAHLKPAHHDALAIEVATLAGGAQALSARAQVLSSAGEHRLACHLIEYAVAAAPADKSLHALRAQVYLRRRETETSLMAKGIFGTAAGESKAIADVD